MSNQYKGIRMPDDQINRIEAWRAAQYKARGAVPSFSDAVRELIEIGLRAAPDDQAD